jgi:hypothetical protein
VLHLDQQELGRAVLDARVLVEREQGAGAEMRDVALAAVNEVRGLDLLGPDLRERLALVERLEVRALLDDAAREPRGGFGARRGIHLRGAVVVVLEHVLSAIMPWTRRSSSSPTSKTSVASTPLIAIGSRVSGRDVVAGEVLGLQADSDEIAPHR